MSRQWPGGLLHQMFFVVLVAQVILGLANSLFVLSDVNVPLALFGFYGCLKDNLPALICVCNALVCSTV